MINIDALNDDEKLAALESIHKSIAESKEIQKKKITTNVELIVKALKKIESDLKQRYDETGQLIANLKNGEDGRDGKDGKDGKNGRDGRDGPVGPRGYDGVPGRNGIDGTDGVSVTDAHIDFDGSLIISLSSGRVINVGEVVAADIAEKIKVITNGGGTSQGVLDAIASLQAQIDSIASGLEYQGTWNASTNVPTLTSSVGTAGYYYIVATAGSTNLNGVTDWQIGDWAVFNGSVWQKIDQTNLVTSVAGRTGAVTLSTSDISGLGTIATQAANNVSITGGSITGITDLAIADGGTGASTAAAAITALTGTQTSGYYLRSNGTSASLSAISAGDVPTLNQNTTGTAAGLSATLATSSGGTGLTSFTANGVVYASSTSALATGSALTFNGTNLSNTGRFIVNNAGSAAGTTDISLGSLSGGAWLNTPSATSGYLAVAGTGALRWDATTIVGSIGGTEGMRLNSTGLGIGTSSPSYKLHIVSSTNAATTVGITNADTSTANYATQAYFRLDIAGNHIGGLKSTAKSLGGLSTQALYLTTAGAYPIAFGLNDSATPSMVLDTTGTLFVNSTARPSSIGGGDNGKLWVKQTTTGNYGIVSIASATDSFTSIANNGTVGVVGTSYGATGSYTPLALYTSDLERARITASGDFGIGTSSPAAKLDVTANAVVMGYFRSSGGSANDKRFTITSGGDRVVLDSAFNSTGASAAFSFTLGGSEQMRLTSTGLGIGTSSPSYKLDITASTSQNGLRVRNTLSNIPTIILGATDTANVDWTIQNNAGNLVFNGGSTGGNVGIGTSSPALKLDVAFSSAGDGIRSYNTLSTGFADVRVGNNSNNNLGFLRVGGSAQGGIYQDSFVVGTGGGYPIKIAPQSAVTATFDVAGNLGLGVTPSAWNTSYKALEIGALGNSLIGFGASDVAISSGAYYSSSGWKYSATNSLGASFYEQYTGGHLWYVKTAVSHSAGDAITFTQAMTLDASGRLGIGTTSPAAVLHSSTTDAQYSLGVNGTTKGFRVVTSSTGTQIQGVDNTLSASYQPLTLGGSYLSFETNGTTERARIDSSGNLLVSTTSTAPRDFTTGSGGTKIPVAGGALEHATTNANCMFINQIGSGAITSLIDFRQNASSIGSISYNGTLVVYNTTSDYRLKNNPLPLTGSGEFIDALQPKTWNWAQDGSKGIGFIAHEFAEVSPSSVSGEKDAVDANGKPVYQSMQASTAEVIANLVAEIQSLRKRLADAGI